MAEAICSTDIRSSGRGYSWPALSDPNAIYARYVAAVSRRDLNAVLTLASDDYVRGLRRLRERSSFMAFFGLWCDSFPAARDVTACFIDGDSAILETVLEIDGTRLSAHVALIHDGVAWRVSAEHCADGRTRIPAPRLAPNKLS